MVTRLLTPMEEVELRLEATEPRVVTRSVDLLNVLTLTATYRTAPHAHTAALAFGGKKPAYVTPTAYVAYPLPGVVIEFRVDMPVPSHRAPGRAAMGPRVRNVLSGRHAAAMPKPGTACGGVLPGWRTVSRVEFESGGAA